MMQDAEFFRNYTQSEAESLFEIDFDSDQGPQMDEEQKQRIYQELMSLEW